MKSVKEILEAKNSKIDVQENATNIIKTDDLKKYLEIASRFLLDETKEIINWMIDNSNWPEKTGHKNASSPLEAFYSAGIPTDPELKNIYKNIGKVVKANRVLEIPVFLSKEQFEAILNKSIALDEIILDLDSEKGRAAVFKKYDKLVWKIAHSFNGKSNLTLDELYSAGLEGLVYAMNNYGKRSAYTKSDEAKLHSFTFLAYASFMIRNQILYDIKNVSRIVRVPVSQQNKERSETGKNSKNNTVSGDQVVSNDKGAKTLFDYISKAPGGESAYLNVNYEDEEKIWKEIFDELEKKFDERTMDIWYSFNELNGHKKMKNKELGQKYNLLPSNITYYLYLVNTYILKNKKIYSKFQELKEIFNESKQIENSNEHFLDV